MKNNNPNFTFTQKIPFKEEGVIYSSYGEIIVDLRTGKLLEVISEDREWQFWAEGISRFDLDEYRGYYKIKNINRCTEFDILDLGYWRDKKLVKPDPRVRAELNSEGRWI